MAETTNSQAMAALEPFIGTWSMAMGVAPNPTDAPLASVTFEWLPGQLFLIQRWEVDHPEAPDGIAIIGFDVTSDAYVQHYFDSRGVARRYDMTFVDNVWTLQRIAPKPDFSQRFIGPFTGDSTSIAGRWEQSDDGSAWSHDFDLTYTRVN
jgi:hypothetical protein